MMLARLLSLHIQFAVLQAVDYVEFDLATSVHIYTHVPYIYRVTVMPYAILTQALKETRLSCIKNAGAMQNSSYITSISPFAGLAAVRAVIAKRV